MSSSWSNSFDKLTSFSISLILRSFVVVSAGSKSFSLVGLTASVKFRASFSLQAIFGSYQKVNLLMIMLPHSAQVYIELYLSQQGHFWRQPYWRHRVYLKKYFLPHCLVILFLARPAPSIVINLIFWSNLNFIIFLVKISSKPLTVCWQPRSEHPIVCVLNFQFWETHETLKGQNHFSDSAAKTSVVVYRTDMFSILKKTHWPRHSFFEAFHSIS